MTVAVRFENVSKRFSLHHNRSRTLQEHIQDFLRGSRPAQPPVAEDTFWALRNVSFEVEQGQTVGLVGANGSGKSTALKLIARILEPTSGSIDVQGRVSALLELGAGFHPDLTGRENIYLNGSLMGLSHKQMERAFDKIVAFSELEEFIDMPVKHYSSGMYMRLAFSVAIHVEPEILLVDEVLAVGDGAFQRKCMERIGDLRRSGVTILLVSHDLDTVARLCHKAIWLDKGEVYRIGEGPEVINNYIAHINVQQQARLEEAVLAEAEEDAGAESASGEEDSESPEAAPVHDAYITAVEVLDADGEPVTSILTGDPITIRFHYQTRRRIETPTFGLALHRDDDVHIAGPNTQVAGYHIDAIEGKGYIDYVAPRLPLAAGRYLISASIYDETCTYCYFYAHQLHSFIVQPRTYWDQLGIVKLDAEWQLTSTPIAAEKTAELELQRVP